MGQSKVKRRRGNPASRRKNGVLLIMCLPAMAMLFIFNYVPMGGLVLAFKNYRFDKGIWGSDWCGFDNFKFFLTSDNAWRITRNTVGLNLLFLVLGTAIAVFFALIINEIRSKKARKFYQTTMFLPYFLSWVVVGYMLYAFLSQTSGILNAVLTSIGFDKVQWYQKPNIWVVLLPLIYIWKSVGYTSVIYYASLMSIDSGYYEAASLDGANRWQMMRHISLPYMKPVIIMLVILGIGKIFNSDFGLFFQTTLNSSALYPVSDVLDTFVYRALRQTGDVGMSAAVGFYQSVVGFILVLTTNTIVRKIDKDSAPF